MSEHENDHTPEIHLEFQNLKVGDRFFLANRLPDENDNWPEFVKLRFNKARNTETGEVEHFTDLSSVWTWTFE